MTDWPKNVGEFLYHISPDVIAIVIGGFFFQLWFTKRANQSESINYLIEGFDELKADALEYWNLDGAVPGELRKARLLEQKIKGTTRSLATDLKNYQTRYKTEMNHEELMMDVIDACTGGSLEGNERKHDEGRYILISNTINRVRTALIKHKM